MIDRITAAGQCDYYEVIIKVIKQGLSGQKLIRYCKQHRTIDFRIGLIRGERENIFNCTRLRFEQHKHGGKKNNNFTDLHFFFRSLLRQTKESENCLKKKNTIQR